MKASSSTIQIKYYCSYHQKNSPNNANLNELSNNVYHSFPVIYNAELVKNLIIRLPFEMNIEQPKRESNSPMCTTCKSFYGCEAYAGMCSQCYKKNKKDPLSQQNEGAKSEKAGIEVTREVKGEDKKEQPGKLAVDSSRCNACRKKLGMMGTQCRCGMFFCKLHRLPEEHDCSFDFKQSGKEKLSKQIVKVAHGKVQGI